LPPARIARGARAAGGPPLKIAYFGNFGTVHRLDLLIKAVEKLEALPLELHFYGSGLKEPNLKKLTQKLQLEPKIIFHGVVSREKSLILMQSYHVLATGAALPYANSSKIFDYLTANRPILGNITGEGAQILKAASPANQITALNSSLGLAQGIKILYKEYPQRLKAAQKHRQLVLQKYTRQKATEKLIKMLNQL
jgi:glycosyltransferase involved in cell wall biosynthesis